MRKHFNIILKSIDTTMVKKKCRERVRERNVKNVTKKDQKTPTMGELVKNDVKSDTECLVGVN